MNELRWGCCVEGGGITINYNKKIGLPKKLSSLDGHIRNDK
jgi:hypothetical protein